MEWSELIERGLIRRKHSRPVGKPGEPFVVEKLTDDIAIASKYALIKGTEASESWFWSNTRPFQDLRRGEALVHHQTMDTYIVVSAGPNKPHLIATCVYELTPEIMGAWEIVPPQA